MNKDIHNVPMRRRAAILISSVILLFMTAAGARAQVYDVSAVGYLNVSLVPGFSLISNPLYSSNYTISDFGENLQGSVPDGLTIYRMEGGIFKAATYNASTDAFEPAGVGADPLPPGRGFFVFNPSPEPALVTFTGEILQGFLTNSLSRGFSIAASIVPQEGALETLGFPVEPGDIIYLWNEVSQAYESSSFDDLEGAWIPSPRSLRTGEAFVLWKRRPALWIREFHAIP